MLQGYIEFAKKSRPFSLELPKLLRWEGCSSEAKTNLKAQSEACEALSWGTCKTETVFKQLLPNPYPWQREMLEILRKPVDPRAIWWIYEKAGGTGKTTLLKHICSCMPELTPIVLSGKASDMMYAIADYERRHKRLPGCVLVNLPRSFDASFLSYPGLESIKDMLFFSGKYAGGMVNGSPPHMAIFANVPPNTSQLSLDRWRIRCIQHLELTEACGQHQAAKAKGAAHS